MSVRPSVYPSARMEQLNSHWTDLHEVWYLSIFREFVDKIPVSLKSDKNNGTSHEDQYPFIILTYLLTYSMEQNLS